MMNYDRDPPGTIPEAIDRLEAGLSEREKQGLCMGGSAGAHHTLGRNIRNGWDLWMPETPLVRWSKETYGVDHADDISGLILGGLHARLCGETFDFASEAERYRQHWDTVGEDGPVGSVVLTHRFPADRPNFASPPRSAFEAPRKRGFIQRLLGAIHDRR